MGITSFCSVLTSTSQHEIDDPVRRLLGRRRRRPRPPGRETHHPHRQAIPEPRHRETRVLFQLRDRERNLRQRERSPSRSETSPKKPEPCPRVNSPTPKAPSPTPSPGWPMRTDSRPPVTTCPLPHPCPSTSSRCSLT